jgi:hypothetical protein
MLKKKVTTGSKVAATKKKAVPETKKTVGKRVAPVTGLAKYRADKAAGKLPAKKGVARKGVAAKKAGARPARKPLPSWQAPADFKPHFMEISVRTEKDGLLGTSIKGTRYVGRYDPNADDKKKFDVGSYDQATLQGVLARLSAVTFKATNEKKFPTDVKGRTEVKGAMRLPANTSFRILIRVNKKSADGSLSIVFKQVEQAVKSAKSGNMRPVILDKKDPVYRAFRKVNRILPAAFKGVLLPPKRTRGRNVEADEE